MPSNRLYQKGTRRLTLAHPRFYSTSKAIKAFACTLAVPEGLAISASLPRRGYLRQRGRGHRAIHFP
jgi:hypothetical protein